MYTLYIFIFITTLKVRPIFLAQFSSSEVVCPIMPCFLNTSDCPVALSLPDLPSTMSCHMGNLCTDISCCISVPVLKRSFELKFKLDACNYEVEASVENLLYKQSLLQYDFGKIFYQLIINGKL